MRKLLLYKWLNHIVRVHQKEGNVRGLLDEVDSVGVMLLVPNGQKVTQVFIPFTQIQEIRILPEETENEAK